MDKFGKSTAQKVLTQTSKTMVAKSDKSENLLLQRSSPYLNTIARNSVLCRNEQRRYAICVSSKGITVEKDECQPQFQSLMECLGLRMKKL